MCSGETVAAAAAAYSKLIRLSKGWTAAHLENTFIVFFVFFLPLSDIAALNRDMIEEGQPAMAKSATSTVRQFFCGQCKSLIMIQPD